MLALVMMAALAMPVQAAGEPAAAPAKPQRVLLETSMGNIELELEAAKAPVTVANFVEYVKSGFYDGLVFHRVIPGFMIQGGGFTPDLQQKSPRAPIKNESSNGLSNSRGTVAMARLAAPDSASSQFFINVVDNSRLDYPHVSGSGYAVFAKVVAGMDVADKIAGVRTTTRGMYSDVPMQAVVIKKAVLED